MLMYAPVLTRLAHTRAQVRASLEDCDLLRAEVHSLGRALLQERTKVKALSQELETPLNVHRCQPPFFVLPLFLCVMPTG
jgi:hypothetical protein